MLFFFFVCLFGNDLTKKKHLGSLVTFKYSNLANQSMLIISHNLWAGTGVSHKA